MDAAERAFIAARAGYRCEYCRLPNQHQNLVPFHVEHIIARQHHGDDSPENLAFACHRCNLHKGTNLVGRDPETGKVTPLFRPRKQQWHDHFRMGKGEIIGLTAVGRTTAELLQMNRLDRLELRKELIAAGLWE
jgi:hypothetical protein